MLKGSNGRLIDSQTELSPLVYYSNQNIMTVDLADHGAALRVSEEGKVHQDEESSSNNKPPKSIICSDRKDTLKVVFNLVVRYPTLAFVAMVALGFFSTCLLVVIVVVLEILEGN